MKRNGMIFFHSTIKNIVIKNDWLPKFPTFAHFVASSGAGKKTAELTTDEEDTRFLF
jgi:hypothetical protein